jgi:hypothetical protein
MTRISHWVTLSCPSAPTELFLSAFVGAHDLTSLLINIVTSPHARTDAPTVAPLLSKMNLLRLGAEKELARAKCGERIHCLVFVVSLGRVLLARSLRHLLVIAPRSYQIRPIDFSGKLQSKLHLPEKVTILETIRVKPLEGLRPPLNAHLYLPGSFAQKHVI